MNPTGDQDLLLQVEGVSKFFPVHSGLLLRKTGDVRAVDNVSFSLRRGETFGLVGESGCGKSTLGRTLIKLYEPSAGRVLFRGQDTTKLSGQGLKTFKRSVQMIFQDPYASLNPRHTVGHIVAEPLRVHFPEMPAADRANKVKSLLRKVGLNPDYTNRYPHEFSGGQRQRISIARAIALEPDLVICDEPVSALDVSIQAQVLNLMKDLQQEFGLTYIFISHDLGVIEHMCSSVAVMYLGRIVEQAPSAELFANPKHPYTKALLGAVPRIGMGKAKMGRALKGDVPSPLKPPTGCHFHPRCAVAGALCSKVLPELAPVSSTHGVACLRATGGDAAAGPVLANNPNQPTNLRPQTTQQPDSH
jgi:oligopeptide transport system ATP-binding protein